LLAKGAKCGEQSGTFVGRIEEQALLDNQMTAPRITSRQNPRVKDAVRLRDGRGRKRQGRFLIDGAREIERAVAAGVRPVEAFVGDSGAADEIVKLLRGAGAEILPVTGEVFEKLCFGERDQCGVVVVAEAPRRELAELPLPATPLVAVIEGVEKPGNLGAILRSADAAGVDAVIVADGRTDLFNPNTIRASLGTVFRPNIIEASSAETLRWLGERGLRVVAARPDATRLYSETDLRGGVAIALGSEAEGLSDAWGGAAIEPVRLPMHGMADSLNVSTTAAVLFYEAVRQRSAAES
jgi:TrmH family RNA methyltransferase